MLFHRWETISHIISDTKLPWLTHADVQEEDDFEFADEEQEGAKGRNHLPKLKLFPTIDN